MNDESSQKSILAHQNVEISPEAQQALNQPLKHQGDIDEKDRQFLKMLIEKIEKGTINLYQPSSLINTTVYSNLTEEAQGIADYDAFNLLTTIREIYRLWQQGHHETFQIENLVHRIRLTKERLEELGGDIYII